MKRELNINILFRTINKLNSLRFFLSLFNIFIKFFISKYIILEIYVQLCLYWNILFPVDPWKTLILKRLTNARSALKRLRSSIGSVYSDGQRSRTCVLLHLIIYSFSSKNRFTDSCSRLNARELNAHSDR